jgi:hypothetical protein
MILISLQYQILQSNGGMTESDRKGGKNNLRGDFVMKLATVAILPV